MRTAKHEVDVGEGAVDELREAFGFNLENRVAFKFGNRDIVLREEVVLGVILAVLEHRRVLEFGSLSHFAFAFLSSRRPLLLSEGERPAVGLCQWVFRDARASAAPSPPPVCDLAGACESLERTRRIDPEPELRFELPELSTSFEMRAMAEKAEPSEVLTSDQFLQGPYRFERNDRFISKNESQEAMFSIRKPTFGFANISTNTLLNK